MHHMIFILVSDTLHTSPHMGCHPMHSKIWKTGEGVTNNDQAFHDCKHGRACLLSSGQWRARELERIKEDTGWLPRLPGALFSPAGELEAGVHQSTPTHR